MSLEEEDDLHYSEFYDRSLTVEETSMDLKRATEIDLMSEEEARKIFQEIDSNNSGGIDAMELRAALNMLGQHVSQNSVNELLKMTATDGFVAFKEFYEFVNQERRDRLRVAEDEQTLEAFVACGGNPDKSGFIDGYQLIEVVKQFGLTLDIDNLMEEVDRDGNGAIDFDEFCFMMEPFT
jgi:calmodulin